MKITVGITAYDSNNYLVSAINSLLNQDTDLWEGILILDGNSNRLTTKIFNRFSHPSFKKYSFKKNKGPYGTRTKAISLCETDWYFQLDGDDELPTNAISEVIKTIKNNPDAEYIYGLTEYFTNRSSWVKKPETDHEALCFTPLFNSTSPIKIQLYKRIGGYSNKIKLNADWDFWLSVYESGVVGAFTEKIIYRRRQRKNNHGSNNIKHRPKVVEYIIDKHPKYFNCELRKNNARYYVYSSMARYYRTVGERIKAADFATMALNYGPSVKIFETIFNEKEMSLSRYMLRRLGRILSN